MAAPAGRSHEQRNRAVEVLRDSSLDHVVALAAWLDGDPSHGSPWLNVANAAGHSRAALADIAAAGRQADVAVQVVGGSDPLADVDPAGAGTHCYPWGWQRLAAALSAGARAPDIAVVHTGTHFWPEKGGHLGEHGSLNEPQSRAPLLVMGAGVPERGVVPGVARTVDVGASLACYAGAPLPGGPGRVVGEMRPADARYVVGLLWDGVPNAEVLRGVEEGWLPRLAELFSGGYALRGGAVADFPSVTLVNHVSALTGVGPDVHQVVHNAFYERAGRAGGNGRSVVANDSTTWHQACELLAPGVRTIFEQVRRERPGVETACVNEPADRGATYSTFGLIRASGERSGAAGLIPGLPDAAQDPYAHHEYVSEDREYARSTAVDAAGLQQMLTLFERAHPPALTWWNTTLTDTGHHAGGPGSEIARAAMIDTDRRLGAWLDLLDRRGRRESTLVLLTADHGSEAADPACRGDWNVALREAGVQVRDEAYGYLYLTSPDGSRLLG